MEFTTGSEKVILFFLALKRNLRYLARLRQFSPSSTFLFQPQTEGAATSDLLLSGLMLDLEIQIMYRIKVWVEWGTHTQKNLFPLHFK